MNNRQGPTEDSPDELEEQRRKGGRAHLYIPATTTLIPSSTNETPTETVKTPLDNLVTTIKQGLGILKDETPDNTKLVPTLNALALLIIDMRKNEHTLNKIWKIVKAEKKLKNYAPFFEGLTSGGNGPEWTTSLTTNRQQLIEFLEFLAPSLEGINRVGSAASSEDAEALAINSALIEVIDAFNKEIPDTGTPLQHFTTPKELVHPDDDTEESSHPTLIPPPSGFFGKSRRNIALGIGAILAIAAVTVGTVSHFSSKKDASAEPTAIITPPPNNPPIEQPATPSPTPAVPVNPACTDTDNLFASYNAPLEGKNEPPTVWGFTDHILNHPTDDNITNVKVRDILSDTRENIWSKLETSPLVDSTRWLSEVKADSLTHGGWEGYWEGINASNLRQLHNLSVKQGPNSNAAKVEAEVLAHAMNAKQIKDTVKTSICGNDKKAVDDTPAKPATKETKDKNDGASSIFNLPTDGYEYINHTVLMQQAKLKAAARRATQITPDKTTPPTNETVDTTKIAVAEKAFVEMINTTETTIAKRRPSANTRLITERLEAVKKIAEGFDPSNIDDLDQRLSTLKTMLDVDNNSPEPEFLKGVAEYRRNIKDAEGNITGRESVRPQYVEAAYKEALQAYNQLKKAREEIQQA